MFSSTLLDKLVASTSLKHPDHTAVHNARYAISQVAQDINDIKRRKDTSSFTRSATSPSFAYVSNPVPDSSLCRAAAPRLRRFSCCSPIASIRFKLLFPVSVRFSCCPPIASLQLLLTTCVRFSCSSQFQQLLDCVRFGCCSPIPSALTAALRLCPLQLQLPDCVRL